ncbi:MAG: hypothetical protein KBC83_00995 [Candidatus Moranbacteria bacterium]|jgi:hypothetical protein|nr:hypothetical protein [Candidatus Moranbacteria bacterium]MBP9801234.1 hypothetical protein [Candidatus Moranbacteria bacterium]
MRIAFFSLLALLFGLGAGIHMTSAAGSKVSICHKTSSAKNPFVIISVNESSQTAHLNHEDVLLDANGECHDTPTFHCIGTLPVNATLYPGDNVVLSEDTPVVFSETDTPAKCEYGIATQG